MGLLETKNTMAVFVAATTIMALVMSPCFGDEGGSISCAGTSSFVLTTILHVGAI
jgi:hypothetical protein